MNLKIYIFLLAFFAFTFIGKAQSMIEYKGIKIYNFKNANDNSFVFPDTLFPIGEWMVAIQGTRLSELSEKELNKIADKAIKAGCIVIYMNLEHKESFNRKTNQVYVLGFERKK